MMWFSILSRTVFGTVALTMALGLTAACSGPDGESTGNPVAPTGAASTPATSATPPSNLAMPVDQNGISLVGVINPFGVVRSSLDEGAVGHPGIDLPSNTGASIYAVADGRIVEVEPATDGASGFKVRLLIGEGSSAGTGWVFLYEHITLVSGLGLDSTVAIGERIAANPLDPAFGNHLELAWTFNNYEFHSNQTCWVPQLEAGAQTSFSNTFNDVLRTNQSFIDAWTTVTFEGRLPFRELLNVGQFPDGARLCYPPGTDVRVDP